MLTWPPKSLKVWPLFWSYHILGGLSHQLSSASAHSLPSRIDQLSDCEDDSVAEDFDLDDLDLDPAPSTPGAAAGDPVSGRTGSARYYDCEPAGSGRPIAGRHLRNQSERRGNKLKRRKAYYSRQRKDITVSGLTTRLTSLSWFNLRHNIKT